SDIALLARVRSLSRLKMMTDELRTRAATSSQIGLADALGEAILDDGLGGRVLLVDDRPSSYERMAEALSVQHQVEVESSPQEALFRLAENSYDLVIANLGLTGFDGLRLCSQIRSLERTRALPILLIVEPEDSQRLLRGLDIGVNDYLMRPIDKNELV